MRISLVRSSFTLHKEMVWCGLHKHFPSNKLGLTSGKFQTAALEPSRAILMLVSGGTIVLSWLATLAIPFLNLFLCSYSGLEWYMKFLLNVSPAVSTTSTLLIISATLILAACNRWIDTQRSSTYCNSRSIVSVLLMAKLAFLFSGFTWASASQFVQSVGSGLEHLHFYNRQDFPGNWHASPHTDRGNLESDLHLVRTATQWSGWATEKAVEEIDDCLHSHSRCQLDPSVRAAGIKLVLLPNYFND